MLKDIQLREYQEKILEELAGMSSIGLFIKTGGGKTYTGLERSLRNGTKHLLVICPQKVITQWQSEIKKTTDYKVVEYKLKDSAKKKNDSINESYAELKDKSMAVVVNFDIIHKLDLDFIDENWTIIVDESHKIKNMYRKDRKGVVKNGFATHKVLELGEKTDYKIIMTATPVEKNYGGYIDYYTQLRFLGYIDYSYQLFKNRYCLIAKRSIPGVPFPIEEIIGYRMEYVNKEIKPLLNASCRFYAPKYNEYEPQMIEVYIPKASKYSKFLRERVYEDILIDNSSAFRIGKMTMTSGTITGTDEFGERYTYKDNTEKLDWLEEFLSNTDEVVSILYNFNVERDAIVEMVKKLGKKYIVIDGSIADKPAELKKDFDVLIGQYRAFGESLDGLQYKCSTMVYYSMPESSVSYTQSLGRIDRIGQKNMPVYYHLVMTGTIDEQIYERIKDKKAFTKLDLDELTIDY